MTDFDNELKNEVNKLSKRVKETSAKGLTKDLINKFSILSGSEYFYSQIFQNPFTFIPLK